MTSSNNNNNIHTKFTENIENLIMSACFQRYIIYFNLTIRVQINLIITRSYHRDKHQIASKTL